MRRLCLKLQLMFALLLCCTALCAQTFEDWTSTNKGTHNSTSDNTYTFNVVEGSVLTFDWSVSSEKNYDWLTITLDGIEIVNKSGSESGSYERTFTSAGTHTLTVVYSKDIVMSDGDDQAQIYNILVTVPLGGTCGENATWALKNNILTISGNGELYDYDDEKLVPWYDNKGDINSVVIERGITTIGDRMFRECENLTDVNIPASITAIGLESFCRCSNLAAVNLPASLLTMERGAFSRTGLTSIVIPEGVTKLATWAFDNSPALASVTLPTTLTSIDDYAFESCTALTSINIPTGVTSIGDGAFGGCTSLSEIYSVAYTPATIYPGTFDGLYETASLYVPVGAKSTYQATDYWNNFANIVGVKESIITDGYLYVYLADGGVDAYRAREIDGDCYVEGDYTCVPLKSGDVYYYTTQEFDSISEVAPLLPEFTSYKFNNKFNPNLFVDAVADTIKSEMNFSLNSIGKWLTASFQLSDDKAVVYVDTIKQESKVTRQSFAKPVNYTVTYPGYNAVRSVKVSDEVWQHIGGTVTEVPLTATMLSTNKPSTLSNEGLGNLLDGVSSTIFHSTWGSANDATVNVNTYIDIALPFSLENFQLYYQCRPQNGYAPLELQIYASNNGSNWTLIRTLTTEDGMPTGSTSSKTYTSPTISLGGSYSYLRILQSQGQYSKNHMALAEMRIYDVEPGEDVLVSEAVYETKKVPYGRDYKVNINWLVDNAVSVPRIDIDIENGLTVTSKDTYLNANFRITGYGVYEDFEDSVQIKGRGNTTWGYPKKPYRLKFESKVKPFGLTKGKSWVLLANYQKGSMMANAVAMKIGQMAGAEYANHIVPVELYVNGSYYGSYMFTEKVGMANNSVDIDEDLGYLLELDTYYDEAYKFGSKYYRLPVNIKEPDLTEYSASAATARKELIQADFNRLDGSLYKGYAVDSLLDLDAFARFMLTNDLVCNQELGHPKSTFLFKEDVENRESKIKFGPLWDFDWAFGYESNGSYGKSDYTSSIFASTMSGESGYKFFSALMNNTDVQKYYYKVWTEFLDKNSMAELLDYMDDYYNYAKSSFVNNATLWSDGTGYASINSTMKQWLSNRAAYLYANLAEFDLDEFNYPLMGDVDKNNLLTVHDLAITTAYMSGDTHASFSFVKADVDGDGIVTADDVAAIESEVLNADFMPAEEYYNRPQAIGGVQVDAFAMRLYEDCILPVKLVRDGNEDYKALQMDITLPDGLIMFEATAGDAAASHSVVLSQRDMTTYRLVVYSNDDEMFNAEEEVVVNLVLNCYTEVAEEDSKVTISNIRAVDEETEELRMNDVSANFVIRSMGVEGDLNADDVVDVADITMLVAMILDSSLATDIADLNADGVVDVADITMLVNLVLGVDSASAAPAHAAATSIISAEGEDGVLEIGIDNPLYQFSALQFDLYLPEEVESEDVVTLGNRACVSHTVTCAKRADGALRVVVMSAKGENFVGAVGDVAAIAIDAPAIDGAYEFELKNVKISSEGTKEELPALKGNIYVNGGFTSIPSISSDAVNNGTSAIYDLGGRKVQQPVKNGVYIKDNKKYIAY